MRRKITFGFFWVMLLSTLFGCANSDRANPNRNQPNMNNTGAMSSNGATNRDEVFNGNGGMSNSGGANTSGNTAMVQDNFWTKAASAGLAEVELGKLAAEKAQNAEVKKFAQMMVADHTKSNQELKTMAAQKNVTLPTGLDSVHQATMQRLQGLTGAEFDRAYVDGQVADHETAVKLMEDNAGNTDAEIKAFAAKSLPIMRSHLETIKGIQSKMK